MKKKIIASALVIANIFSLASCSLFNNKAKESEALAEIEDGVYESVEAITESLANCDYDTFQRYCKNNPKTVKKAMPLIEEDDSNPKKDLLVRNMIAATITSEIDEDSFEASVLSTSSSIDVTFSYKDYHQVFKKCDLFVNPGDFNSRLEEVTDTVDITITLNFQQEDNEYLLVNASDLAKLYDYDDTDLDYMDSFFDMVEDIYMTGDNWDPAAGAYIDTNTFEIVLVLSEQASEYIWQYIYRVALEESYFEWTDIYISGEVIEHYPTEIHIVYTQDEIFDTGFYVIAFYNYYDDQVIGYEFDVYKTRNSESAETSEEVIETESE